MILDIAALRRRLGDAYPIEHHDEISSTNDRALQLAHAGAPGGTLVCAEYQSAGRGRRGTTWSAPVGSSVLCSLLLRPAVMPPPQHLAIITGAGAANGLRTLDIGAKIKWPNDLMLQDRKIAGILVETAGDAVVIGFGVNCTVPEEAFPPDIRDRAGSLHTLTGQPIIREDVLISVVQGLTDAAARVEAGGIIKILYDWNTQNWLSRRKVRVSGPMGALDGDGLFLDGHKLVFHVFKDYGVVAMPLSSTVEVR
ncbi:MAG: biotin--[acetyl-CoA-carboxylase] ligase [Armatimonadota bacterium]